MIDSSVGIKRDAPLLVEERIDEHATLLHARLDAGKERYKYFYLDIASLLSDENGDLLENCTTDGIHLSAIGYFKWAAELARGNRMMHSLKKNLPNL